MTRCIFCEGTEFISIEVPDVRTVDGKEYADTVFAEKCASCGEPYFSSSALSVRTDRLIAELEKINNPSPEVTKYIERHKRGRKKLAKLREEHGR